MTYLTQNNIAISATMRNRVAQCAASEGIAEPDSWAGNNCRTWAASPDWDAAWEYALNMHSDEPDYDPGADEAVITDGMILSQVQVMTAPPPVVTPLEEPAAEEPVEEPT